MYKRKIFYCDTIAQYFSRKANNISDFNMLTEKGRTNE